ncbi:hypothetical protein N7492_009877 [Penicillium capsulatum]|uniref:Uncharacterized protein n=1 Tax=Penicillium capsulatum TaxID=69766 RepID=A0A9W9LER1_9EURO|nr:hypothetical protein N7492_009877 [Penicillium capsulatum]
MASKRAAEGEAGNNGGKRRFSTRLNPLRRLVRGNQGQEATNPGTAQASNGNGNGNGSGSGNGNGSGSGSGKDNDKGKGKAKDNDDAKRPPPLPDYPVQNPPIMDIKKVPNDLDWNPNDLDIDDKDVDANIARCNQRIATGILPQIWENRIGGYLEEKKQKEKQISKLPKGLDQAVYDRLRELEWIKQALGKDKAQPSQIPNVKAVIKAYKSGKLVLGKDQVVYFAGGQQLGAPQAWDQNEYLKIQRANQNRGAFWVEGANSATELNEATSTVIAPQPFKSDDKFTVTFPPFIHEVILQIRIPGSDHALKAAFMDDTGAANTMLHTEDITSLETLDGTQRAPPLGVVTASTPGGRIPVNRYLLEARVMASDGEKPLTKWIQVPVMAVSASLQGYRRSRLSGGWWRHMLYVASAPDNSGNLYVHTTQPGLSDMLPDVDAAQAHAPKTKSDANTVGTASKPAYVGQPKPQAGTNLIQF